MPRYWVIAPVESKKPELFDKVWQFDIANNLISIGWNELGDISKMTREALSDAAAAAYPGKPPATRALYCNMLWAFYHEIGLGDFVIARRGRKVLAAVGKVVRTGFYAPGKNPFLASPDYSHSSFLEVEWQAQPRDKVFPSLVFPMHTLWQISEVLYGNLMEGSGIATVISAASEPSEPIDQSAFVLEKYLEDFIVSNFGTIFKDKLQIYETDEGGNGQQYQTDIGFIDILARERGSSSFVVIELKKGRPSDQVIGQILRYMGWVKKNLCKDGQTVKGLVICRDPDPKLDYALEMTNNIDVRYYSVSFKLRESP
jgi:restriction system protein